MGRCPMKPTDRRSGKLLIALLVLLIASCQYSTQSALHHYHVLFRELYFIPIVLAGFFFGLRTALVTSLSVTLLVVPYVWINWQAFSPNDFTAILEVLLYNGMAVAIGALSDRERIKQKKLLDVERLAAIGRALSGVAHDMKSPIIAIGGMTQLVQRGFSEDHPSHQKLEMVLQQARRLENLTKDLLDFARPLELQRTPTDLNRLIGQSLESVGIEATKKGVVIAPDFLESLPPVSIDPLRLDRVFINLVNNAIQASPEGQTVHIRTRLEKGVIVVDVVDCGCGIQPDERDRLFEPFFTTKREGTGLGLPIAKKIVESHGGRLHFMSSPDKGTTFRVELPAE
jgi:signal transduction histidine kinase